MATTALRPIRQTVPLVKFRRETQADGFFLEEGVESVRFDVPGEHRPFLVVLPLAKDPKSHRLRALLRAEVEFEPSGAIVDAFASLEDGRLPRDTPRRDDWPDYISDDGVIEDGRLIPELILSNKLQAFFNSVHNELTRVTHDVFGVLRWRMAIEGPREPSLGGEATWWAEKKQQWLPFPSSTSVKLSVRAISPLRPDIQADAQRMLDCQHQEPLAHLLLREARGQQAANPRSAVLIGLSALETGVKQFVSGRVPDASWLVEESQAPPIVRMLTEYLPKLLDSDGASFRPPEGQVLNTLKKGVRLRNRVAHLGYSDFREDTVEDVLDAVESMLWRLDAAAGFSWADWRTTDYEDQS